MYVKSCAAVSLLRWWLKRERALYWLLCGILFTALAQAAVKRVPVQFRQSKITAAQQYAFDLLGFGSRAPIGKVLFTSKHDIKEVLIGLIATEQRRIIVASYIITDGDISNALIEAQRRGVSVEVVVCRSGVSDRLSKVSKLIESGVRVFIYPHAFIQSLMHHKFWIFDFLFGGRAVCSTGSFNATPTAAKKNRENLVFAEDPKLIHAFKEEFGDLKAASVAMQKQTYH